MDEINNVNNTEEKIRAEEESVGNVKISADVVSTIAGVATMACTGVYGMAGTLTGDIAARFGVKNPNKGVKVDMTETDITVDLFIIVKYGVKIPELAWEIQDNVKKNIESMTGIRVEKVNIHIEGVNFDEEEPEDIPETADAPEADAPAAAAVEEKTEDSADGTGE